MASSRRAQLSSDPGRDRRARHVHRPLDRLTQPLVRNEAGELVPISWDIALDRAADGFRRAITNRGGDSIGLFSCSKSTNEMNYLAQKLARTCFGSNNIDSCNRT